MKTRTILLSIKRTMFAGAFIVFSFSFMRGCDPVTSLAFKIENQADSQVIVELFGLGKAWEGKMDSVKILEPQEVFKVFHEEQMGTSPEPTRHETVYFVDSIRVTHVNKNSVSGRNYMNLDEWVFRKDSQLLTIREEDFN